MLRNLSLAVFVLLVLCAYSLDAQEGRLVKGGERVRITPTSGSRVTGVLLVRSDSTLLLATAKERDVALALSAIQSIEVSLGRDFLRAAQIGASAGVMIGAIVGTVTEKPCSQRQNRIVGCPPTGWLIGGGIGALIGAVVGVAVAPERWAPGSLAGAQLGAMRFDDGAVGPVVLVRF